MSRILFVNPIVRMVQLQQRLLVMSEVTEVVKHQDVISINRCSITGNVVTGIAYFLMALPF